MLSFSTHVPVYVGRVPREVNPSHSLRELPFISLPVTYHRRVVIPVASILFLEADNNYTTFVLEDGQRLLLSKTLKTFLPDLNDPWLVRLHKSFVINLRFLDYYDAEDGQVRLSDGQRVPVSRRKRKDFEARLRDLMHRNDPVPQVA
jgi:two-component system LytT family response regulator